MKRNEIAAAIHKRMCEDDRFGYSWEERYGANPETWTIGGKRYSVRVGDYDCSSSTITAWAIALRGTAYDGKLDGATYTGNMREVFVKSGLFEWKPMSFQACPGDLYLNEANHVAMCQTQVPDMLSEFSWGDNGAYGNRRGDQSGGEASVHAYYDYPWDGILHYNGKADSSTTVKKSAPAQPRYHVHDGKAWRGGWKSCGQTAGGSAIYDLGFSGLPKGSWYQLKLTDGTWLGRNEHNLKRKLPVCGIRVYYETADPEKTGYWEAVYRARVKATGQWLAWKHDVNAGGTGSGVKPLDAFQFKIAEC